MKKILITGADGFIDHILPNYLLMRAVMKGFVLYNSLGSLGWLDNINKEVLDSLEIFKGDIRDPYGVRNAVKGWRRY